MIFNKAFERDGGNGGAFQFLSRAIGLNVERIEERRDTFFHFMRGDGLTQCRELIDFDHFHVAAEGRALLREIGVDVEHAAVVVTHQAEAVVLHDIDSVRSLDPFIHFSPGEGVIVEGSGDLMEWNARSREYVCDFRNGTSAAPSQPLAGHMLPVAHFIEGAVVDSSTGGEVEDDDRYFCPADNR